MLLMQPQNFVLVLQMGNIFARLVVVVVVVGQTVGSISNKTLTYDCLYTHLNCARHRRLLPVNTDIWRIFWPVFVQAVLERVHCSAAYNFTW